ncbi:hypothetical protein [Chamaesiphon minutus]|uniref:Uncharacterized protein n=1 Tax=Chamaesiphon minutus (strain ATCC 27169 / PCC 6605) TaxID=1173020 RepID=K9UQZ8_CHAP6|nr:hypothetical protein [Chamaesiphon minutus]AFY97108.1 hypothetical protein Cha6605_6282 [Chamaesiphon minutus PCC 6605]
MLAQQPSTVQQGFTFTELLPGLVICNAPAEDPHGWGNADADKPAFLVYLGYNIPQERDEWIARLRLIWGICGEIVYRPSQRVSGYWHEIKIREMQRYSDPAVFDLDYLSESLSYGLDFLVYMRQQELEATDYEEMVASRLLTSR